MKKHIEILQLSGPVDDALLRSACEDFRQMGFSVACPSHPKDDWPYTSGSADSRKEHLRSALHDPNTQIIYAARGGYGASDLLEDLFEQLRNLPCNKVLVGFSDVCALHAGVYSLKQKEPQLPLELVHGPMPASSLWDIRYEPNALFLRTLLKSPTTTRCSLQTKHISINGAGPPSEITGPVFGGCFSVLTNLIGTPYFPNLKDHVLFFEDVGENLGRMERHANQWLHSGSFHGVKAMIWGAVNHFEPTNTNSSKSNKEGSKVICEKNSCEETSAEQERRKKESELAFEFLRRLAQKTSIPVFSSEAIGHIRENPPIQLGRIATIQNEVLEWDFSLP